MTKVAFDWENPDLDIEMRISDFAIEHEIRKRVGFHCRIILDFLSVRLGNPKKDCKTVLVNSGVLFVNDACACKTAVLKESFSNPFPDFPIER